MAFQIKESTNSATIHDIIIKAITELNRHEQAVFSSSRTKSTYISELSDHPIIKTVLQTAK